ncbi:MAG: hypothetical protein ACREEM_45765 [Blastocatellia bacterium]
MKERAKHFPISQMRGASVAGLDAQVGRPIGELDQLGLGENTLTVFSSDKGPEDIHIGNASHSGMGIAGWRWRLRFE